MSLNNFLPIPEGIKFFLSETQPKRSPTPQYPLIKKNDDNTISVPPKIHEIITVFQELHMLDPTVSFLEILVSNKFSLILKINPNKKLGWVSGRTILHITQIIPNGALLLGTKTFNPKTYKNQQIVESVELLSSLKEKPTMENISHLIMLKHVFPDKEPAMLGKIVSTRIRFDLMVETVHRELWDKETLELFAQSPPIYVEEFLTSYN